jgi:natural product biosynthesis luciferase-like monooxygenase protein
VVLLAAPVIGRPANLEFAILNLPADRPRPPVQTYRGAAHRLTLDRALTQKLKRLSTANGATLYMTLLAAFQVLLYRYTGQTDLLVGSPTAGRGRQAWSGLVGYFVNPLVLRADLSGNPTFTAFLEQVRQTVLAAFEHQAYAFPLLAERLQPVRDPSRSPLFQVMFILQQAPGHEASGWGEVALGMDNARLSLGTLPIETVAMAHRTSQFDLTLVVAEIEAGLGCAFQYNTDLFDAPTIARLAEHFQTLVEGITAGPHQPIGVLPLLSDAARRQLLVEWNHTRADYAVDQCIHQCFEAQVARQPGATAVVFEGQALSYAELNRQANQLAHYLRARGIGPEHRVAICMERSLEMMVGLLGILKAGGAYVPLDPAYPRERLGFMLEDSGAQVLLTQQRLRAHLPQTRAGVLCLDADWPRIAGAQHPDTTPHSALGAERLAYVMYTSGSTGKPKGVMVCHRNVINFFQGMDERLGCNETDTLLAVTSISFDISVLELFWTLARGARVVLLAEQAATGPGSPAEPARRQEALQFSLFYFASVESGSQDGADKYQLLLEGARFADQHGFSAVWTPERHFHPFGGLYPNPSVVSAALAAVTHRLHIRAGSVVLPLHHPVRIAEEWSLVDNLSHGRVGVAFASGWHADDFVFFPEHYPDRKAVTYDGIQTVQRLWRGEAITVRGGAGNEIEVRLFPKPVQPELPVWITAAGDPQTFVRAGAMGANVLTHLLGQTLEAVAEKIRLYRQARAQHGHDPESGCVTLMLHTFIGEDLDAVREKVRQPFTDYLRSSVGLFETLIKSLNLPLDLNAMSPKDMEDLLAFAFDRYFDTSALFGTPETCAPMIERLRAIGVDEVACLIDFGVETGAVLESLQHLNRLKDNTRIRAATARPTLAGQAQAYQATLMQCTPSLMRMLRLAPEVLDGLQSLRALLLGGEALPPRLAQELQAALPARLFNMYGPTETTIWSATHAVDKVGSTVPIGRPLANTQVYILDGHLEPVPPGVAGELYIGGEGLARGYLNRPDLTAERFVPNPFVLDDRRPATHDSRPLPAVTRLYKTGDLARYLPDGTLEYLGRIDQQVKIRGFRIELEEIEASLEKHPAVRQAAVAVRAAAAPQADGDEPDKRLVAYVVLRAGAAVHAGELRDYLKEELPDYMAPAVVMFLEALPLTANGKIDRRSLPNPDGRRPDLTGGYVAPRSQLEQVIVQVWREALKVEKVGVQDNFFDLGGHSLLMAQVHGQLREALQRDLPLVKLLEYPTVSALARYLSQDSDPASVFQPAYDRAQKQQASLKRQRERARPEAKTS